MSSSYFNEPVIVSATFGQDTGVQPVWFLWNERKIMVEKTNFRWTERRGADSLYHFAVTDGSDLFELVLDTASLNWHLAGVEPGQ